MMWYCVQEFNLFLKSLHQPLRTLNQHINTTSKIQSFFSRALYILGRLNAVINIWSCFTLIDRSYLRASLTLMAATSSDAEHQAVNQLE